MEMKISQKDSNGNMYYEDKSAPYGRTRWVEYPTPPGVWCIEMKYDGSMVSPEWHGWLHYVHDKPGNQLAKEFEKPFKQPHTINQSMLRPEFSRDGLDAPVPPAFHQPPGATGARVERGRDYWAGGLRKQVSSGDWAAIQAALEKKGVLSHCLSAGSPH